MKSRIFVIIILCFILTACFFGTYSMLHTDEEEAEVLKENITTCVRSQVYSDCLENNIKLKGVVVNKRGEENYSLSSEVGKYENVHINCKLRDRVSKDDVIFTINSKEYKSEIDGIVIDIVNENEYVSVSILDYEALYIESGINYVYVDKLRIGQKIDVSESNPLASKETHKEIVENIGYEIEDNMIEVMLSNNIHYLPGTSVELEFKYMDEIEACYVLKQMILEDASGKYVYVESDGIREKRTIETGKEFSATNDGVTNEYIEICSGVSEGERLVVDVSE